jgi:hypothetical protein
VACVVAKRKKIWVSKQASKQGKKESNVMAIVGKGRSSGVWRAIECLSK